MGTRSERMNKRDTLMDRRGSADRRASQRNEDGGHAGRRAADAAREADSVERPTHDPAPRRKRRATRDGREALVVYLQPACIKAVKIAALELDTTASALVSEALDQWLRARA